MRRLTLILLFSLLVTPTFSARPRKAKRVRKAHRPVATAITKSKVKLPAKPSLKLELELHSFEGTTAIAFRRSKNDTDQPIPIFDPLSVKNKELIFLGGFAHGTTEVVVADNEDTHEDLLIFKGKFTNWRAAAQQLADILRSAYLSPKFDVKFSESKDCTLPATPCRDLILPSTKPAQAKEVKHDQKPTDRVQNQ